MVATSIELTFRETTLKTALVTVPVKGGAAKITMQQMLITESIISSAAKLVVETHSTHLDSPLTMMNSLDQNHEEKIPQHVIGR
mmetsp:Transcript_19571/g.47812  ORF Transcript_19571/g.47812 Transcript_19571/m.47812 type:complete len:84 (+) Transcript_19571:563-814(+)